MRLAHLAILGILALAPCAAFADNGANTGVNFGSARCDGAVSCTAEPAAMQSIAASATSCANMHFGARGYSFDPNALLDGGGCLTAVPPANLTTTKTGLNMAPHCCVIHDSNSCHVECQLIGTH